MTGDYAIGDRLPLLPVRAAAPRTKDGLHLTWLLTRCATGKERDCAAWFHGEGIETCVPLMRFWRRKNRKGPAIREPIERAALPGYVPVCIAGDDAAAITMALHAHHPDWHWSALPTGQRLIRMCERDIDQIRRLDQTGAFDIQLPAAEPIQEGDRVSGTIGLAPCETEFEGIRVLEIIDGRARLDFRLLGKEITAPVEALRKIGGVS